MHPWDWPEQPWQWIHLDYASLFMGKMFFIAINAHSKWMEVEVVNSAMTQATVECLQSIFARFGLPKVMVTDNGMCFISSRFAECNKICHVQISPYHQEVSSLLLL